MRKLIAALTSLSLLALPALTSSVSAEDLPAPGGVVTDFDEAKNAKAHTSIQRANAQFLSEQEATGTRLSHGDKAGYSGDYGHRGCTLTKKYAVGDTEVFNASMSIAGRPLGNQEITAVLAGKSKYGYMWVQEEFWVPVGAPPLPEGGFVTQAEADAALQDWNSIYVQNRKYFGPEPRPNVIPVNLPPGLPSNWRDADCDPRVHILNYPIDSPNEGLSYTAGYYSSEHEYPNGNKPNQSPFSNEKEMFFMNSGQLDVGGDDYAGVLAHEFFHMIQFGNDYNEATWVNEGLADIAAVVNGFGGVVDGHVSAYEEDPDVHLLDWSGELHDYGQAFLFFDYLFTHYGAPEDTQTEDLESYGLAKLMTKTGPDGIKGVTKVLATRSTSLKSKLNKYYRKGNFKKVFKDFLVANILDNPEANVGQFGYELRDVAVTTAGTDDASPADSTVQPYGGEYYDLTGNGTVKTTAEDPVAVIPAKEGQPKPVGGFFGWSNRSDEMVTWLQRKANLTNAKTPRLVYRYWHQIEEDWDYAYVRVSTNGGKTWQYQNTSACGGKNTDPNGNNRSVAETGGITGNSEGWKKCSLPLSKYAGKKALIRFEYDTDQAVTEPGFVVDNVRVREGKAKHIWGPAKFESAKSTKAWKFGGDGLQKWLRMKPLAKNQPLYQIVSVNGNNVTRKVLTRKSFTRKNGKLESPSKPINAERTILIFSGVTPIATTPFGYSYNVTR